MRFLLLEASSHVTALFNYDLAARIDDAMRRTEESAKKASTSAAPSDDLALHVRSELCLVDDHGTGDVFYRVTRAAEEIAASRKSAAPSRPHKLAWNGNEWIAPCGCRYHPDDDNGSHGGAPHVHRCDRHQESAAAPGADAIASWLESRGHGVAAECVRSRWGASAPAPASPRAKEGE